MKNKESETIEEFRKSTLPKYANFIKYQDKIKKVSEIEKQQREIMNKIKRYVECYYQLKKEHSDLEEKKEQIKKEIESEIV